MHGLNNVKLDNLYHTQWLIQVLWGLKLIQLLGSPLREKAYKIRNTKLDTEVNIYLGPSQGLGSGQCFLPFIMQHTI